jgi:eukaryotic-like serine/threonine-protein kinase
MTDAADVKQSLEDAWREIDPYLDEMFEIEAAGWDAWVGDLESRSPVIAARVRAYLVELRQLQEQDFLGTTAVSLAASANLTGQCFGAYTLDRVIGHGGMGTVWLAHRSDGRFAGQAAVKLLNAALVGHPAARRFAREGNVLARLHHANIAHLLDAGVAAGSQPYLILEYVSGERLDRYCDRRQLDLNQRITLTDH